MDCPGGSTWLRRPEVTSVGGARSPLLEEPHAPVRAWHLLGEALDPDAVELAGYRMGTSALAPNRVNSAGALTEIMKQARDAEPQARL